MTSANVSPSQPVPDLHELCVRAVQAAAPGEDVEAYAEESRRTQVRAREGEVEWLSFSEARGVGVRVISSGRVGYAYAADPEPRMVAELVRNAREAARFAGQDSANVLPPLEPLVPLEGIFREELGAVATDRKVQVALDLERAATSAREEVRRVESATYGDAVSRVSLASTRGGPVGYGRTDCWATVSSLAERDGETQTGFAYRLARDLDELEWEDAAEEAAERAARLLGGTKPSTARVPVVFDPVVGAAFLGVLAGPLSAESVLKGRSLLTGMVGSRVGSEALTLVDDGRLTLGPAAAPVDDEGVGTRRTELIDRGVLRGFLHNTYTATRARERSTGNAARGSYRTTPGVRPTNLFLEPGTSTGEELLRNAEGGVFLQEVTGLHSGANPISGQFSVGAVGLRVSGGALGAPLREMTVASTLIEMLSSIGALGADLRFAPAGGGLGSPTILVREMTVAGA